LAASVFAKARWMLANRPSPASSSSSVPSTAPTPASAPDGTIVDDGTDYDENEEEDDDEEATASRTVPFLPTEVPTLSTEVEKSTAQVELHTRTDGIVITTAKFDDAIKKGLINIKQCNVDMDIRLAPDNLPLLLKKSGNVFSSGTSSIYKNVCRNGSKWSVRLDQ
jgi:hypothetical protein